jgi:hypothetical protein
MFFTVITCKKARCKTSIFNECKFTERIFHREDAETQRKNSKIKFHILCALASLRFMEYGES